MKERSIGEINERIKDGKARVMTAEELSDKVRAGEDVTLEDVDVVTTGTCGIMSGTAAILSFPIGGEGTGRSIRSGSMELRVIQGHVRTRALVL